MSWKWMLAPWAVLLSACSPSHLEVRNADAQTNQGRLMGCDRLEPLPWKVSDPYDSYPPEHDVALTQTLFSRVPVPHADPTRSEGLFMTMTKLPVVSPPEAVFILAPAEDESHQFYRVVHTKATEPIPYEGRLVPTSSSEAFLDREVVLALERVWSTMTARARWSDFKSIFRTRNPPYTKSVFDYRQPHVFSQGVAFSPKAGTCALALEQMGELLIRFANEPEEEERGKVRALLWEKIQNLALRLRATEEESCGGTRCRASMP